MPKYFQIVLDDDVYNEWLRWWGAYGVRQFVMRRVVIMMINRARSKHGLPPIKLQRNIDTTSLEKGTLSDQLNKLIEDEMGGDEDGNWTKDH